MPDFGILNDIAAVTVPASSTLQATFAVGKSVRMMVKLTVATAALTNFTISARATTAATYDVLYSTTADFTTPKGVLVGCSGDLTLLGIGSGWFIMDVRGMESVRLFATSAGTATLALNMGAT